MTFFPTVKQFISKALVPLGSTMYIYGGGWNESDTGAGGSARAIGASPCWKSFFESCRSDYDFRTCGGSRTSGLDCTGYIGWAVYNLFNDTDGKKGYVFKSSVLGERLSALGLGSVTDERYIDSRRCGDIFYSEKHFHAYIAIGEYTDGSVLLLHSSPPGVMLSGTTSALGKYGSLAQRAAALYMAEHCPEWVKKYPCSDRGIDYLHGYKRFRFYRVVVPDPDGITDLPPDAALRLCL